MSFILVLTGASGAGKTATVTALAARDIPGVRCFHFDSIGVPSPSEMEREYGGVEQWQAWATVHWLTRLGELPADVRVAVLDGQTRPQFVLEAAGRAPSRRIHVVLFDCSPEVRSARLRGPRRQPELADERMDHWAAYLRGQADALGIPVVDTSTLTLLDATRRLELIVHSLLELDASDAR